MSGYPNQPPSYGYGYGAPPPSQSYGAPPPSQSHGSHPPPSQSYGAPPTSQSYGAPPPSQSYGAPPPSQSYGAPPPSQSYGAPSSGSYGQPSAPYAAPYQKPPKEDSHSHSGGGSGAATAYPPPSYASPFASLLPSTFPPGTDPSIVACFQVADQDGSGLIDDKELQRALSSYNQSFSLRTVHLLMYHFTNTNVKKIDLDGDMPSSKLGVYARIMCVTSPIYLGMWVYCLACAEAPANIGIFERFDKDRSGKIDSNELRDALLSLGYAVSPVVLDLLVSKFDKTGGKNKAIEYDNFIECCLTVK
ncbi:putative calcium-binding protein CML49-like, partial [Trifolium pratense]